MDEFGFVQAWHGAACNMPDYAITSICDIYNLGKFKAVCEPYGRLSCQMRTCNSLICAPMHKEFFRKTRMIYKES